MRIVLLTGNQLRHRFAAAKLAKSCPLAGVLFEAKSPVMAASESLADEDRLTIQQHFAERDQVESDFLGNINPSFSGVQVQEVPSGSVNSAAVLDWIRGCEP